MKILVPVDGSSASLDAVQHALQLIREGLQASLVLANVQEPASLWELLRVHGAEQIEAICRSAGEHSLQEAAALCQAAGAEFVQEIAQGEPAATLHDIAEEQGCDLVVMGARGKGETPGTRLGSVAHALLHDAALPVTIVRHPPAPEVEPEGE
ncbi:MAG: universal stress protein [Piscinibacter sp.]|uniref:universal stress protein n=1 Tax=Piscinibacter sp. TaxID=1903157 RepID=UPI0025861D3D|nr:universal stress protein [Piscinibacter sp.]MCW5665505.1 universal stress protein [Piscinibacter sp.]